VLAFPRATSADVEQGRRHLRHT